MSTQLVTQPMLEVFVGEDGEPYTTTFAIHKFTSKQHTNVVRTAESVLPGLGLDLDSLRRHQPQASGGNPIKVYRIPLSHSIALTCKLDLPLGAMLTEQLLRGISPVKEPVMEHPPSADQGMTQVLDYLKRLDERFSAIESSRQVSKPVPMTIGFREPISFGVPDDAELNPRDIGRLIGMSGQTVNQLFLALGLQTRPHLTWQPTSKVEGLYVVTKFNWASGIQKIDRFLWKKGVLDLIPEECIRRSSN